MAWWSFKCPCVLFFHQGGGVYYQAEENEKETLILKKKKKKELPESTKKAIKDLSDWVESKWVSPPKDYTRMSRKEEC